MWLLYISMLEYRQGRYKHAQNSLRRVFCLFFFNIYMHHLISCLVVYTEDWISQAFVIFSSEKLLGNFTRAQCKKKSHNLKKKMEKTPLSLQSDLVFTILMLNTSKMSPLPLAELHVKWSNGKTD